MHCVPGVLLNLHGAEFTDNVRQHSKVTHYYFHALTFSSYPQCFLDRRLTRIHSQELVSVAPFLQYCFLTTMLVFFSVVSHSDHCMPCLPVPHVQKAVSCGSLRTFISVTKEVKQREQTNTWRLDVVLRFKEDERTKRDKYTVVCCLSFLLISSVKGDLVLFLYNQLIVHCF